MYALEDESLRVASYLCEARGVSEKEGRRAACGEGYAECFQPLPWPLQGTWQILMLILCPHPSDPRNSAICTSSQGKQWL